ncbi:rRNA-processing protein EFG1-like isoform X2 [Amaranthus tricolor]|uniref:rRNA-processing protein EFG1-like isoform X2 n=1 Tax=Amaranthus tricolor TaxID=29722 RepID=UPI0025887445|nr:rRNA-processing protein EFG1-like isoform X2 [Amaranthus tricolor]
MPHGGYGKRRVAGRKTTTSTSHRSKLSGGVNKKPKAASLKNQIRSTERLLRKELPPEIRLAQERKLDELKKQQDLHIRLAVERKIFLRDRKIKFFERRKIERRMRRLEKHLRSSSGQAQEKEISEQLAHLKEDLEYVRFFPKTEKYLSLFCGDDDAELVERRNRFREQIKANLIAAAATGKDLEETGSEDDGLADMSDDDFFLSGTSSDEADADDELTDLSAREQASSASGKAASGFSSDDKNQKQKSARSLMPPPRPQKSSTHRNVYASRNTSHPRAAYSGNRGSSNSQTGQSSNMSSNSDAPKRKRKRRPKKKKQ